ncbi:GIY-YIG nuclease family protein [Lysobacter sp. CA199]|uniref:GIY-YIG nuclease family protein n=1 Tax=Lysobacter sp. CA199 TaxID=3455608 RepID=UPI003F8CFC3A
MPGWTYLLLSNKGEVYLGATQNLRQRFRTHNSKTNDGWTRGRRWHLLAVLLFPTRDEAFDHEKDLKTRLHKKSQWKVKCIPRAEKILRRHGYSFDPHIWSRSYRKKLARLTEPASPPTSGAED